MFIRCEREIEILKLAAACSAGASFQPRYYLFLTEGVWSRILFTAGIAIVALTGVCEWGASGACAEWSEYGYVWNWLVNVNRFVRCARAFLLYLVCSTTQRREQYFFVFVEERDGGSLATCGL